MYLAESLKRAVEKVIGRGKPTARQARAAVRKRQPTKFLFQDDGSGIGRYIVIVEAWR